MKKNILLFLLFVSFKQITAKDPCISPGNSSCSLTITITPPGGTPTFCTGKSYQFSGSASPGTIVFYQWSCLPSMGVAIMNGSCSSCNNPSITFNNIGTYTLTLVATNNSGCVDSVKYQLSVSVTPTVTTSSITPSPVFCQGGTGAVMHVVGATTYTWTPLTNLTPFGSGDSAGVNPPGVGVYTYSVTGSTGGCTSLPKSITVTVTSVPVPAFVITPSNDSICSKASGHLYVNNLPANTNYTWTAAASAGLGTNSGSNTSVSPNYYGPVDSTYNYFVNFNVPGCPPYPTYTLSIVIVPTPTISVVSDTVQNCNHMGDSISVNCIPSSGVIFIWSPTTFMTPPNGIGNPVFVNPNNPTLYYCYPITNSLGCTGRKDSVSVIICVAGVNEFAKGKNILIYPNPSNGSISISSAENIDEIKITDIIGQIIYENKPNAEKLNLQIEKSGVYFVTVISGNKSTTQKLIIQ